MRQLYGLMTEPIVSEHFTLSGVVIDVFVIFINVIVYIGKIKAFLRFF